MSHWQRITPPPPEPETIYTGIFIPTRPDNDVRPGVIIPNAAHVVENTTLHHARQTIAIRDGKYPYNHIMLLRRHAAGNDVPDWWIEENIHDLPNSQHLPSITEWIGNRFYTIEFL